MRSMGGIVSRKRLKSWGIAGLGLIVLVLALLYSYRVSRFTQRSVLRVSYAQNPPLYSSKNGAPVEGAMVDMLDAAGKAVGVRFEWVLTKDPPEVLLPNGIVDLWPMAAINEERKRRFHLTK